MNLSSKQAKMSEITINQMKQIEEQIDYVRTYYPFKKLKIKDYGVVSLDAFDSVEDIEGLLKNYIIKCEHCKKRVGFKKGWILCIYNPKEDSKPINVYFFCRKKNINCAYKWGLKKMSS